MCKIALIILLSGIGIASALSNDQEYFSSITGLESLLRTEDLLLHDFGEFIKMSKLQINTFESEYNKIKNEHIAAASDMENYLNNPVNAYRLIKRLSNDWQHIEDRVRKDVIVKFFLERMTDNRKNLDFPTQDDVDGSAEALVRLQETYKLDVRQVAAGILNGVQYGSGMTWQDCFALGQRLYQMEDYNNTKSWLKESMERLNQEKYSNEPTALDYKERVAENLLVLGDIDTALKLSYQVLDMDPRRGKAWKVRDKAEHFLHHAELEPPVKKPTKENIYHQTEEYKHYGKLCRGEVSTPPSQLRHLRCRFVSNNVPYRLIAPFKVEEHNLDPLVLTFHDMITDRRIETIKELATPHMKRSTVQQITTKQSYRVSQNAWLPYDMHPYTSQILLDLHDVTGLDMTIAEELQVANYGIGGHYEPHFDFFMKLKEEEREEAGNRIATAIYYLSDVEQGGATAFPHLNIAVKPQKGNVLFFYNLHRSLDFDFRSRHAGCPVLKGSKWIGNVWIRERKQVFIRPCDLYRDHEISLPYRITK